MRVVGVGKFVRDMERFIRIARAQNQKILITKEDRPYFVVTPLNQLDADDITEAKEALRVSKKRTQLKKAQLARMKIIREIEKKKRELLRLPITHSC